MTYAVKFKKGSSRPWKIIKKSTGEVVGSSVTKVAAESLRERRARKEKAKKRRIYPV